MSLDTHKEMASTKLAGILSENLQHKGTQKLLRKAQKDPKIQQMISRLMASESGKKSTSNSPRDRVKDKIRQSRMCRGGKFRQQAFAEKQDNVDTNTEKVEEKKVEEQTTKHVVQGKIDETIKIVKNSKKKRNDKIKRLAKKYGTISIEQWTDAIAVVNDYQEGNKKGTSEDQFNHVKNIIELYNSQQSTNPEKTIDIVDLDDSDSEICDLDNK